MIKFFMCAAVFLTFSCSNNPGSVATQQKANETATTVSYIVPDSLAPKFGKYGCTSTKFVKGFYEYTERGTFEITKDGHYTYYGFEKPSSGTYTVNEKGDLLFHGGYFDSGKAEKIDRPNKFFLIFPAIPGNRWTCGYVEDK